MNSIEGLFKAVENNDVEQVKALIQNGADVNAKDENDWTPLHAASAEGFINIAKLLIEKGADVNIKNDEKKTPLILVSELVFSENASKGVEKKLSTLIPNANSYLEIARLLIQNSADVNAKDEISWTALHYSAANENVELFKLLIENGADKNVKDNYGKTALDLIDDQSKEGNEMIHIIQAM